ncbi:MAG: Mov34/MPN/PAD-1 family protein [archaeon]|nr:Mov34/MPN/PAD-1 family protein [archaeon]
MKILKRLLEDLLQASRNTFPNEFLALLAVNKEQVIAEFVLIPTIYGKTHAIFRRDLMPIDKSIVGSYHSHPSNSSKPSSADLRVFSGIGKIHLIGHYPYNFDTIKAFNEEGKIIELEIIE